MESRSRGTSVPFKSDASAEVYFKCLDPDDPELKQSSESGTRVTDPKPVDPYEEIARLNELRKSGALTYEEFTAEKKKILSRAK